jgi:protein arginine kinase activator
MNTLLSSQKEKSKESQPALSGNPEQACPNCGMTLGRFAKTPLLGCSHDYTEFHTELMPLIKQSHNGQSHHCGKVPTRICEHDRNEIERNKLRRQLDQAVKNEDYETAARLRDKIQALS